MQLTSVAFLIVTVQALRQAITGAAAITAGVSGTPRSPGPRSGDEGETAHDQQRHDRSAAGSGAKDEPWQWLAPTTEGTQRGAAADASAHV